MFKNWDTRLLEIERTIRNRATVAQDIRAQVAGDFKVGCAGMSGAERKTFSNSLHVGRGYGSKNMRDALRAHLALDQLLLNHSKLPVKLPASLQTALVQAPAKLDDVIKNCRVGVASIAQLPRTFVAAKTVPANPIVMQRGSTCGLYALEWVLSVRVKGIPAPKATQDKQRNPVDPLHPSLRKLAKQKHFTAIGELFRVDDVVALAAEYGVPAVKKNVLTRDELFKEIKTAVDGDNVVLVPFCVENPAGFPQQTGEGAHWCAAFGYADGTSVDLRRVLVTHWGQYFEFDVDSLQRSNACIADWQKQDWGKDLVSPLDYDEVQKGKVYKKVVTIQAEKLSQTLAKQIVVI